MSSTTERSRGQALAIFGLSLAAVLMAAALAFDGGMLYVERRDQQNAVDAAAIAGARYLVNNGINARTAARNAADAIATANGFTSGSSETVSINIPPTRGQFRGLPGYIEVEIDANRPSIFAGIMGVVGWDVSARAVALNGDGATGGFSILALDPEKCPSVTIEGNGSMLAYGNIQVNSTCELSDDPKGAMRTAGNGDITVDVEGGSCDVVGDVNEGKPDSINCDTPPDVLQMADPLGAIAAPVRPLTTAPRPMNLDDPSDIVDTCPGSGDANKEPTLTEPNTCTINGAGERWRLFPGLYPGGINLGAGTFYLDPGIYWIGGGGVTFGGNDSEVYSTATGGTTYCSSPAADCGVMFYNSHLPGTGQKGMAGDFALGGGSSIVKVDPIDDDVYGGIVFWQERLPNAEPFPGQQPHPGTLEAADQPEFKIVGGDSLASFRGTIYSPGGHIHVRGGDPPPGETAQLIMDQIIALTYQVEGVTNSEIKALVQDDYVFKLRAAGLVE